MIAIAEAPSKVIVTGEHFVVHGAWALAAAVSRNVRVEVSGSDHLSVLSDRFGSREAEALAPLRTVVGNLAREFSFSPALRVSVVSGIPHGAGLGSSASTMVALVSALSRLHSLGLSRKDIASYSMVGEKEIHGRPSGIDSAICASGGVILFRAGIGSTKVRFEGRRTLLVAYTGESRSTRRQIGRVSRMKESSPKTFERMTESVNDLSLKAADRLVDGDMKGLGRLLNINQSLLHDLGVSTPRVERLVELFISLGCYGAKLTGAGGGGSVVAVSPEGKEKSITSEVKAAGFDSFMVDVPIRGVRSWLER